MVYPVCGSCVMHAQRQPGMYFGVLTRDDGYYVTTWNYPSHVAAFCAGQLSVRFNGGRLIGIGRWK